MLQANDAMAEVKLNENDEIYNSTTQNIITSLIKIDR